MAVMGMTRGTSTAARNEKPQWANETLRLDPYALPQKVSYDRMAQPSREARGPSREARGVEFTLNKTGAVMKRVLDCGIPLSMALPARAFVGVAARAYEDDDGTNTVTLELLHADEDLSVPLCVSEYVEDVAADWHSWSNNLRLPMLLIDEAGNAQVVKSARGLTSREPKPRRRRRSTLHPRPLFLRRRKTAMVGPVIRVSADEIIART